MKKAALIIDGPNVSASANALGFRVDWKRLHEYFSKDYDIFRSLFFTALPPRTVNAPIHQLVDWLKDNQFMVISKEMKEYTALDGSVKSKGNMDVEICIHSYEISREVDELIMFTGDGDFKFLVETVQRMNKKVTVVSATEMCSRNLRGQADKFIDMNKISQHINRVTTSKTTIERRRRFIME